MPRATWFLATANQRPVLNPEARMERQRSMSHSDQSTVESLWISVALSLVAIVYLRRWLRVAWLVPGGVKSWRACSFFAGLLLVWIGLGSRLSLLDHDLLTLHMVQHLLLMTIAPPLMLLGAPLKLLLQRPVLRLVEPIARPLPWAPMRQLARILLHPAVGWLGATAALVAWHIPAIFMLGLRSQTWHVIEEASFLVAGFLFWWPVIEPSRSVLKWPESSILLYLFLASLPCDILSGFLVFCDRVVYPVLSSSPRPLGFSALEDQQCAGSLMWTCVTVVYLIAGAVFTARLLSPLHSPHRPEELALPQFDARRMEARRTDPHRMGAL
jgi:putative membrane protein